MWRHCDASSSQLLTELLAYACVCSYSCYTKKPRFSKKRFLYENRTRKYSKNATEKHPVYGTLYLTKYKSPVSEGEHHVKNGDEIDEYVKSQF